MLYVPSANLTLRGHKLPPCFRALIQFGSLFGARALVSVLKKDMDGVHYSRLP